IAPTQSVAARFNSVYESSDSFRHGVERKRYGINPAVKARVGSRAAIQVDFEHFRDERTADRGIPSFQGLPYRTRSSTFFGDPEGSVSDARVNAVTATVSRSDAGPFTVRNHTRVAGYDKFYQNIFPASMNNDGSTVAIQAYNNSTERTNLFNQTDLTAGFGLGGVKHAMLFGAEVGRQTTDNFRNTGYFNNTATSLSAPAKSPTISVPITYRQSATDADNHTVADVLSAYVQDQLTFGSRWMAVAGLRYESFDLRFRNNRNDISLERRDVMLSPRVGLTHKPSDRVSLYAMYGVSHLPSSGDQFASLTDVTRGLEPERFTNREVGAKWQVSTGLEMSAAWYVLDRTNTRANDPTDPGRTVQTGSQRTSGYELEFRGSVTRSWDVIGGVSRQHARIRNATTAGPAGALVPLVPRLTAAMWNRYQLSPRLAVGAGVTHQAKSYAAIDNAVILPRFTEVDGALYYSFSRMLQAQINVDNLLDGKHYHTANNNNNISPGGPRSMRLTIATEF
ncbi:MAG TPA: TonB-dependent receptor, partial [Gemmatimonadaceae bacterium]|nr:TonB-dependent receptor [Gemmatimonadaceae bacterium]